MNESRWSQEHGFGFTELMIQIAFEEVIARALRSMTTPICEHKSRQRTAAMRAKTSRPA